MRGALQAKSLRLPPSISGVRWSSSIARLRLWRRERAIDHLEQIERFQREHRRLASLGTRDPDSRRQWIRRF
jgi:hypothetical protein